MKYLIYLLIGLLGVWLGRNLTVRRRAGQARLLKAELMKMAEKGRKKIAEKIRGRKNKILQYAKEKGRITNNDVEKMFCGISNSTARRYLDELEKDGHLKQVGNTGRGVYYKPINTPNA